MTRPNRRTSAAASDDAVVEDGLVGVLIEIRDLLAARARSDRALGACNLLTVAEAVAELGMGDQEGRAFLEEHGLVHHVGRPRRGSGRVVAGDLAEAVRNAGRKPRAVRAPTVLPLPKTTRF